MYWKEPESRFSLYRCDLEKPILIGITSDRFIYSIKQDRIRNGPAFVPYLSKLGDTAVLLENLNPPKSFEIQTIHGNNAED
jgi:hypothetical protein